MITALRPSPPPPLVVPPSLCMGLHTLPLPLCQRPDLPSVGLVCPPGCDPLSLALGEIGVFWSWHNLIQ